MFILQPPEVRCLGGYGWHDSAVAKHRSFQVSANMRLLSMQPHHSHVRRPVSTCAFRAHNTKKHYKSTQCVADKGVHENPSQAPVVPLAPYLHSFCRSCVSETENSFERGLLQSKPPPRHARHVMGAARRGSALDTAGAVLHTPATPGHTIGLLRRPEVTSTFSVGKANPSGPGIGNRRISTPPGGGPWRTTEATEAVTDGREER